MSEQGDYSEYAGEVAQEAGTGRPPVNVGSPAFGAMRLVRETVAAAYTHGQEQALAHGVSMRQGPAIGDLEYEAFSHEELHSMVNTNLSPAQVNDTGRDWDNLGQALQRVAGKLQKAAGDSESAWHGDAGDAARNALTSTAKWCDGTGQGARLVGNHMYTQSEASSTAKNSMPEPVSFDPAAAVATLKSPDGNPFKPNVEAYQQNIDSQVSAMESAHKQAAHVVATYDSGLGSTSRQFPEFPKPPEFDPSSGDDSGMHSDDHDPGQTFHRPPPTVAGDSDSTGTGQADVSSNDPSSPKAPPQPPGDTEPPPRLGDQQTATTAQSAGPTSAPTVPGGPSGIGPTPGANHAVSPRAGSLYAPVGTGGPGESRYRGTSGHGGATVRRGGAGDAVPSRRGTTEGPRSGGGRSGARPTPTAAERAAARAAGTEPGRARRMGPIARGRGGKGEEDSEHKRKIKITAGDPDSLFYGDDMPKVAPPCIGELDNEQR